MSSCTVAPPSIEIGAFGLVTSWMLADPVNVALIGQVVLAFSVHGLVGVFVHELAKIFPLVSALQYRTPRVSRLFAFT